MKPIRKIKNIQFKRVGRANNKVHAKAIADVIRKKGLNTRVIHTKSGGHGIYVGNQRKYLTKFPTDMPYSQGLNPEDWYSTFVDRYKDFGEMPEADDPKFAWYGDGPIDEYLPSDPNKDFTFEIDDPMEAWGELLAPGEPPLVCRKDGDCGCEGIEEDHDDRSYGCWPCPVCGDDSDMNYGQTCSRCVIDVKGSSFITGEEKRLLELHARSNIQPIRFPLTMTHGTSLQNWRQIQKDGEINAGCFATPFGTNELGIPDTFADIAADNSRSGEIFLEVIIENKEDMERFFKPDYEMYNMSMGVLEDEYYNDPTGSAVPLWNTDSAWMETLAKMNKQRDPKYMLWPKSDKDWESGFQTTHTLCIRDTIPISRIRVRRSS